MQQDTYLESILSYFTSMDIEKLRLCFKEEYSYQETTKEIFLNKIEEVFKAHKNSGDTKLLMYEGECGSKTCKNCGLKGYRFVGNHSKNYIDLLFEIEGDDIKDICCCQEFKTYEEIDGLETKSSIYFDLDDHVDFPRTPEYWSKVYAAKAAYSEMITTPPRLLPFKDLCYWLDKHSFTNAKIGNFKLFKPYFKWSPFSSLYADLQEMRTYISDHLNEFIQANYLSNQIKTEQNLIDWLLKYEVIYEESSLDLKYCFRKEGEGYILNEQKKIIYTGEEFQHTLTFIDFYRNHYEELLGKYNTYTEEEKNEAYSNQSSDLEDIDVFSLIFHLEKRKALEEIGINIPLYLNQESNQSESINC